MQKGSAGALKLDPTVCACFVLEAGSEWPLGEHLWQVLEDLCAIWLVVVPEKTESEVPEEGCTDLCQRFSGNIIRAQGGQDPYVLAVSEAAKRATHLWLLDSQSIVNSPSAIGFPELHDGNFILHRISEYEWQWRRTLVSSRLDWEYDKNAHQWECPDFGAGGNYCSHLRVEIHASKEWSRNNAVRRLAECLQDIDVDTARPDICAEIARCYESMEDIQSAASWYHQAAQRTETHTPEHKYYRFRYWRLLEELPGTIQIQERQQQWLALYDQWPDRAEPLYYLLHTCIELKEWEKAWSLVQIALETSAPRDSIPFESWIYDHGLAYAAAQCADARDDYSNVLKYSVTAMQSPSLRPELKSRLYQWQSRAYDLSQPYLPLSWESCNHFVVIIAFRNCAKYLQACIDSLKIQHYKDFEAIFIDDASNDGGLENCDLEGLPSYTLIKRAERLEALHNQVDVLQKYCDPSDIAVFLDGDDRLADAGVLEYLNGIYNQTGCWMTYGQFTFNDGPETGYARPILESESISSLYQGGLMFPIHMRTHRAGLIRELMDLDPELKCLKGDGGRYVQSASDVAHTRALLMIIPRERVRYIAKILYRYNVNNPYSHFRTESKKGQLRECQNLAKLPELKMATRYSAFQLNRYQKARLLLVVLPGADRGVVAEMLDNEELPQIRSMLASREIYSFEPHKGLGNYQPMRELLCGEQVRDHNDLARYVPRRNAYTTLGFERPYMMTGPFFGESQILDGRHYAVLGVSDVNIPKMGNLTLISQWLCHAQFSDTRIHPQALQEVLESDERFKEFGVSLERCSVADEDDAHEVLDILSRRIELKLEVFNQILKRGDWDCVVVGIDELHDLGHHLWHFWDREHPLYRAGGKRVRERMAALYRQVDEKVGQLLAHAGQVPTVLIGGPGMQANGSLNSHLDVMLRRFEAVYTGTVSQAQRNKERLFYAQYTDPAGGGIRLNLQGREPDGKVTQAQYKEVCEFLIECFAGVCNKQTGTPVTREIYCSREHYGVSENSSFPDLLCVWEPGAAYGAIESDRLGTIKLEPEARNVLDFRTGDHNGDVWGVFNEHAAPYFPLQERIPLHRMGHYFRTIVENFK